MWKPWRRTSSSKVHGTTTTTAAAVSSSSPKSFRCSSFKDVETLCTEDNDDEFDDNNNNFDSEPSTTTTTAHNDTATATTSTDHQSFNHNHHHHHQNNIPQSPRRSRHNTKKIFHRVRTASSLIRNWPTSTTTTTTRPESPSSIINPPPHNSFNLPLPDQLQHQLNLHQDPQHQQQNDHHNHNHNHHHNHNNNLPPLHQQQKIDQHNLLPQHPTTPPTSTPHTPTTPISIPGAENRVVIYTTSLHAVRPTFQACRTVQSILAGFRVPIDERDLAMDSGFLEELQTLLGTDEVMTLPRVFIGGRYIGGAEELNMMDENGELKKFLEGLPDAVPSVCKSCGGYRFVLCGVCNGSHKVFFDRVGEFRECVACQVNGIVRCSSCNPTPLV